MKTKAVIIIVLTFVVASCTNSDSKLHQKYIEQYNSSIELINIENSYYYGKMYAIFSEYSFGEKYLVKNALVKRKTLDLTMIIDSLISINQTDLLHDKSIKINKLRKSDLDTLKEKIDSLKAYSLSLITDKVNDISLVNGLIKNLSVENWNSIDVFSSKSVNIKEFAACLLSLKLTVLLNEHLMYAYIFSGVGGNSFRFGHIGPEIIPKSQIIRSGETYKAEILLGAYDTTFILNYEIEGKAFSHTNGKIPYKEKVKEKSGKVSRNGGIKLRFPRTGKDSIIPFTIQYKVLEK